MASESKWRHHGVRVVKSDQLDSNTAQTPGMSRAAAINHARMGAEKLWAGTVVIHPKAKTGAHHHGPVESVIYVVSGRARMRWGERLEFTAEAGPGDFIYVPPYVPHQEINASDTEPLSCVLVAAARSRSSSTSTCRMSSPIPRTCRGSTTFIPGPVDRRMCPAPACLRMARAAHRGARVLALASSWPALRVRIEEALVPSATMEHWLAASGAASHPADVGITLARRACHSLTRRALAQPSRRQWLPSA